MRGFIESWVRTIQSLELIITFKKLILTQPQGLQHDQVTTTEVNSNLI